MEGHLQPNQKQRCLHEMDVLQHHPVPIACALVDGIDSNLMCGQTREVCLQGMVLYRGTCVCSSLAQAAGLQAFSCPWPMEMLWRLPAACSDIEKRKRQAQCGVDVVQQRARTNSIAAKLCEEAVGGHIADCFSNSKPKTLKNAS